MTEETRSRVVGELVATERAYVRDLDVCSKVFLQPLRERVGTRKELLNLVEISYIFSIMDQLVSSSFAPLYY